MPAPMEFDQASIYGLADPETGEVRYIGKAASPKRRYAGHLRETRRKTPLYCWIASLTKRGLKPSLVILIEASADWRADEKRLIAEARSRGERLLNVADGGDQPHCSAEVRAANGRRVAASRDKRFWSLKRDIGQALRDGCLNEATKAKMRLAAVRHPDKFGEWACV